MLANMFSVLIICNFLLPLRYKLIRTNNLNQEQAFKLFSLQEEYDIWKLPKPGSSADIMVEPERHFELSNFLAKNGIHFNETIKDIGELIRFQQTEQFEDRNMNGNISFDSYFSHADVSDFQILYVPQEKTS